MPPSLEDAVRQLDKWDMQDGIGGKFYTFTLFYVVLFPVPELPQQWKLPQHFHAGRRRRAIQSVARRILVSNEIFYNLQRVLYPKQKRSHGMWTYRTKWGHGIQRRSFLFKPKFIL